MVRHLRTRFFIANSAKARWVEHQTGQVDPVTVGELEVTVTHRPHGPPYTAFESAGPARRGHGDRDTAELRTDDAGRQLAEEIDRQASAGAFERLGLVAPARLLHAIRKHLSGQARAKVCFELARDLTKHPNHELHNWLDTADLRPTADIAGH
jgi:hypothetical protein